MLKRIKIEQLRLGMHIHEVNGAWMGQPSWSVTCLIDKPADLQALLSSGITEIWIDTSKGADLGGSAQEAASVSVEIITPSSAPAAVTAEPHIEIEQRVGVEQEAERAIKICEHAKQAVATMFHEARMGKALSGNDALSIVEEISHSVSRNPGALISLARLKNKDDYTYMHSVAVCALMVSLANQLELDTQQVRQAGLAGLVHDIGKMMIPTEILNKPGKLTDTEFTMIKNHPGEGHKLLLEGSDISDVALDVCLHHHEKIDGSGYPEGLKDEQISQYAKMGAVCDVYDAITSNRPYKNGWEPADSLRKMSDWCPRHFDRVVFEAFVKSVGIYPVGSLIRLESNRLAVVIKQSEKSLLTPIVKIFFSIRSDCHIPVEIVDLSKSHCREKIVSHESPEKWGITNILELWSGILV